MRHGEGTSVGYFTHALPQLLDPYVAIPHRQTFVLETDVAFERTWDQAGITYAALPQVAVDLMTSPGRGPAEAAALIEWMEENEDAWRRPGSRSG